MKLLMLDVPESVIEERRRRGLDARDEVWEGVYHMGPPPSNVHQSIVDKLHVLFSVYFEKHRLGLIRSGIGVRDAGSAQQSYRVPEWFALRTGREHLLRDDSSYVDEGPDAVVEVRSPGDETDEKRPFYERVAVGELLIVDRDSRKPEVWRRAGAALAPLSPATDGWLLCEALRAFFRAGEKDGKPVLRVRLELDGTEHLI
ncbi:MAG: Uma2 family endonuclease [Planctomycetes bacterium]|nr:Uma2 family endonuclease [Planctomycetota bacterium]